MELVNRIRQNQSEGMVIERAVDAAVDSCIAEGILTDFLVGHRAEVRDMCITEFNEKTFVRGIREEGRVEGRAEERKQMISQMLRAGKTPEEITDFCGYDLTEVQAVADSMLTTV
jgi:predicted transposase YdaD